ncbi:MAG: autotransporter outer membrane beta-barrel domain-containing protein, partial [Phascolarctobacterium sp.]|nr:autotransporter outer membrane beta-barrel domain-containing protein [Candidatus Phascolarctobacterium caballi]
GTVNMYNANVKFDGNVTNNASSVFNAKNSMIEVGGKLTVNGTATLESTDLNITGTDGIDVDGTFNMNGGTLTAEEISGNGTFNGISGNLHVKSSSVKNLTLGGGLEVHISLPTAHLAADFDGSVIDGVFYNVNTSFTGGANLIIDDGSLDLGSYYVIVSGDAVNTDGDNHNIFGSISCNDASMEIVPVSEEALEGTGLTLDKFKNMIVLKTTEGDILLHEKKLEPYYPVMEAIKDDTGSEANKLYADLKNAYRKNHKGGVAAMESLLGQPNVASMFKSGLQVASLISNATLDHTSLVERDVNYSTNHYKPSLRNMVADSPDMDSDPEYIGVGKVTDIMPYRSSKSSSQSNYSSPRSSVGRQSAYNRTVQRDYYSNYEEERRTSRPAVDRYSKSSYGGGKSYGSLKNLQSYSGSDANKQVWAAYLHSKEDIDGLQTGGTEREGTNTTNGAVVGADLWSTEHAFGGLSVSYATTDVETANDFSKITNDVKSYGIGIYHRHDYRRGAMIFDGGFTHNKNEIKQEMNLANSYEIKSKPKVEIFDAGLRYEHKCHVDENAAVVPYIGVRYTMVDPDSYCNNIGIRYGTRHDD